MKKIGTLSILSALLLTGCGVPDGNFAESGRPTVVKIEKWKNLNGSDNNEVALFTIDTKIYGRLDEMSSTVIILLPIKSGKVGDILTEVKFSTPKTIAEDERK